MQTIFTVLTVAQFQRLKGEGLTFTVHADEDKEPEEVGDWETCNNYIQGMYPPTCQTWQVCTNLNMAQVAKVLA